MNLLVCRMPLRLEVLDDADRTVIVNRRWAEHTVAGCMLFGPVIFGWFPDGLGHAPGRSPKLRPEFTGVIRCKWVNLVEKQSGQN